MLVVILLSLKMIYFQQFSVRPAAAAASTEERRDEPLEARRLWSSALNDAHIIFIIAVERTRSTRVANEKVLGCENGRRLQVPSVCDRAAALDTARAPAATTGTSLRSCSDPPLPPLVTMTTPRPSNVIESNPQ